MSIHRSSRIRSTPAHLTSGPRRAACGAPPRSRRPAQGGELAWSSAHGGGRCEFCSAWLAADHRHLFEPDRRVLRCGCEGCLGRTPRAGSAAPALRRVPERLWALDDLSLPERVWRELGVPAAPAFLWPSATQGGALLCWAEPPGLREARLPEAAWRRIRASHPALATLESDVEALLLQRDGARPRHWLVPVSECCRFARCARAGGEHAHTALAALFDELDARARRVAGGRVVRAAEHPAGERGPAGLWGSDPAHELARACLYAGYALWPRSGPEPPRRERWTFGALFPQAWSERHGEERSCSRSEFLLEAEPGASLALELRFLHVLERRLAPLGHPDEDAPPGPVALRCSEASERQLRLARLRLEALAAEPRHLPLRVPAGRHDEASLCADGAPARLTRRWEELRGTLEVSATVLATGLYRVSLRLRNTTPCPAEERDDALRRAFAAAHFVLRARAARFVSQSNPPEALRRHAQGCANLGSWPALLGRRGARDTLLAAALGLPDYPRLAPLRRAELGRASRAGALLRLALLSLPEAERHELTRGDPRARALLAEVRARAAAAQRPGSGPQRGCAPLWPD